MNRGQLLLCLLLCCSLTINVYLSLNLQKGKKYSETGNEEGWSREAAEEAERVASISCSGHGRAFLDGLESSSSVDGKPAALCECYACFTGPDCSLMLSSNTCVADANSGNPLFLEPFWWNHASSSAVLIAGWHRMGYAFGDGTEMSASLENHIRALHDSVGNAVTRGKYIVFGTGSTQLLNSAVRALSASSFSSRRKPVKVVAAAPYYQAYRVQTNLFRSDLYEFQGDASVWENNNSTNSCSDDQFIEFVTSPNNPDCQLRRPLLEGSNVKTIHDHAYYWPHFTPISAPADEDLMIFTLSKLTGHAGSRFGWALIKDEAIYRSMTNYEKLNTVGVSHDTQLRALKLLKVALHNSSQEIFEFGHTTMSERWRRLSDIFSHSTRFSLQNISPGFCNFFGRVKQPSPAYAWVRCDEDEDEDCYQVFLSAGIIGRDGRQFGGEDGYRYVRLTLLRTQDDFDLLINKLRDLLTSSQHLYYKQAA